MTHAGHSDLVLLDLEIKRTIYKLNHAQEKNMATKDPNNVNPGLDIAVKE